MKAEYIHEGTEIGTTAGFVVCKSYNGSIVYADSYGVDAEGHEAIIHMDDMFTLSEIGALMKAIDGRNHIIRWDEKFSRYQEFEAACDKIAEQCSAEGYPSHGSNYELRIQALKEDFQDLFGDGEDE